MVQNSIGNWILFSVFRRRAYSSYITMYISGLVDRGGNEIFRRLKKLDHKRTVNGLTLDFSSLLTAALFHGLESKELQRKRWRGTYG